MRWKRKVLIALDEIEILLCDINVNIFCVLKRFPRFAGVDCNHEGLC